MADGFGICQNASNERSVVYIVKETMQAVIDDDSYGVRFSSFFEADDFCRVCEKEGLHVYIEMVDACGPILTNEDLNRYAELPYIGVDPRQGFETFEIPRVLAFLGYCAEAKAMVASSIKEAKMYEQLAYAYVGIADRM